MGELVEGFSLVLVSSGAFDEFRRELEVGVKRCFPGFGFSPGEISKFLGQNEKPFDDRHYLLKEGEAVVAVAMTCGSLLEYAIPLDWDRRYEVVAAAISAVRGVVPGLYLRVHEGVPSHAAWYAGLLPSLGFAMNPRVRMGMPVKGLPVGDGYAVERMEDAWLDEVIRLHLEAIRPPVEAEMEESLRSSFGMEDRRASWFVARERGEVVGSCFGSHHRGRIFVEELAVTEGYHGRGIGRRLLLASVGLLARAFPEAETVVLDVDRVNGAAVGLYRSLGFEVGEMYLVARVGALTVAGDG